MCSLSCFAEYRNLIALQATTVHAQNQTVTVYAVNPTGTATVDITDQPVEWEILTESPVGIAANGDITYSVEVGVLPLITGTSGIPPVVGTSIMMFPTYTVTGESIDAASYGPRV